MNVETETMQKFFARVVRWVLIPGNAAIAFFVGASVLWGVVISIVGLEILLSGDFALTLVAK